MYFSKALTSGEAYLSKKYIVNHQNLQHVSVICEIHFLSGFKNHVHASSDELISSLKLKVFQNSFPEKKLICLLFPAIKYSKHCSVEINNRKRR